MRVAVTPVTVEAVVKSLASVMVAEKSAALAVVPEATSSVKISVSPLPKPVMGLTTEKVS